MAEVEIFYADPVDADGNVIAKARFWDFKASWTDDVSVTKIPHDELVLDDAVRIRMEDAPPS